MTAKEALELVREARQRLLDDWAKMTPEQIRDEIRLARVEILGQEAADALPDEPPLKQICRRVDREQVSPDD